MRQRLANLWFNAGLTNINSVKVVDEEETLIAPSRNLCNHVENVKFSKESWKTWYQGLFQKQERCSCYTVHLRAEYNVSQINPTQMTAPVSAKRQDRVQRLKKHWVSVAEVTTCERKFSVVPWAAEFWCTVTSPLFALPLLTYRDYSPSSLSTFANFSIMYSVLTALCSAIYHAKLLRIYSVLDCFTASTMYMSSVAHLFRTLYPQSPTITFITDPSTLFALFSCLLAIYMIFNTKTHILTLAICGSILPSAIYAMIQMGLYFSLISGATGIACFMFDRMGLGRYHSMWHVGGGIWCWGVVVGCVEFGQVTE